MSLSKQTYSLKNSYAACYGIFKFIDIRKDSGYYVNFLSWIQFIAKNFQNTDDSWEPWLNMIKKVIKNIYKFFQGQKVGIRLAKENYEQLIEVIYHVYPELMHDGDEMMYFI